MQFTHEDLLAGKYNDVEAWACSFHYRTFDLSKATRNVSPIKVWLNYNKTNDGYFIIDPSYRVLIKIINKNGRITKSLYYRDNTNNKVSFLSIFDNEKECRDHYVNMIEIVHQKIKKDLDEYIIFKTKQLGSIKELQKKWEK